MINRIIILFLLFIGIGGMISQSQGLLYGVNERAGTHGFAFMKLPYSARAMGMANAFSALSNDGDAVFFNTAGLAQVKTTQVKINYMNYIEGLQGGSAVFSTNLAEDWVVAPFIQFLASDEIIRTDIIGNQHGTFTTSNMVAGLGFARTMHPALDFGVNLKYVYESLESYNASAAAIDISLIHQTNNENLRLGVSLRNFGMQLTYFTESEYEENLPTMLITGLTYSFHDRGSLNFDLCRPFDNDFFFRFGLEYHYNSVFTIRGGIDSRMNDYRTDETMDFLSGIAFGAGFNFGRYTLDYGISSMGSLGFVNQFSLTYNF